MAGYDLRAGGRRALGTDPRRQAPDQAPAPGPPPLGELASAGACDHSPSSTGGQSPRKGLPGTQRSRGSRQLNVSVPAHLMEQVGAALSADPSMTIGDLVLTSLQRFQPPVRSTDEAGPFAATPRKTRRQLGGARTLAFYLTHDQAAGLQDLAHQVGGTYSSVVTDALDSHLATLDPDAG